MIAIRRAQAQDYQNTAALLYSSGQQSLQALFAAEQTQILAYLEQALTQPDGQFGYANHWVAESEGEAVGLVCAWHHALGRDFHQATLTSLIDFFGAEHTAQTLARSQWLAQKAPAPTAQEYCLGHLAVADNARRQNIATQLCQHVFAEGKALGKQRLILDVVADNTQAIGFYQQLGLAVESTPPSKDSSIEASADSAMFPDYLRMAIRL